MSSLETRYQPAPVPNNLDDLPPYLYDEFYRVAEAIPVQGLQLLYGAVPAFTLNTTPVILTNYAGGAGPVDQATGQIIVPVSGIYRLTGGITGTMSSPNNNNQYALNVVANGAPSLAAVNDVSHVGANRCALSATVTNFFTQSDVLELQMIASASMGTCTLTGSTFELERLA